MVIRERRAPLYGLDLIGLSRFWSQISLWIIVWVFALFGLVKAQAATAFALKRRSRRVIDFDDGALLDRLCVLRS